MWVLPLRFFPCAFWDRILFILQFCFGVKDNCSVCAQWNKDLSPPALWYLTQITNHRNWFSLLATTWLLSRSDVQRDIVLPRAELVGTQGNMQAEGGILAVLYSPPLTRAHKYDMCCNLPTMPYADQILEDATALTCFIYDVQPLISQSVIEFSSASLRAYNDALMHRMQRWNNHNIIVFDCKRAKAMCIYYPEMKRTGFIFTGMVTVWRFPQLTMKYGEKFGRNKRIPCGSC